MASQKNENVNISTSKERKGKDKGLLKKKGERFLEKKRKIKKWKDKGLWEKGKDKGLCIRKGKMSSQKWKDIERKK